MKDPHSPAARAHCRPPNCSQILGKQAMDRMRIVLTVNPEEKDKIITDLVKNGFYSTPSLGAGAPAAIDRACEPEAKGRGSAIAALCLQPATTAIIRAAHPS